MKRLFKKTLPTGAAAIAAVVGFAGCAANPATGGHTFSLVSQSEERAIGESAAEDALKTYGLYKPEGRTARYIVDLCQRTWAQTEMASDPVTCNFMDDGRFNAYATPGYMFVNRGLLAFVSSEAELAAVLGHEAGHLTARHINRHATQAKVANMGMLLLAGVVAAKSNDRALTETAIAAGGVGATLGMAAFSRAHETEADGLGRRYMQRLGYDPREAVNMVQAMQLQGVYQEKLATALNPAAAGGLSLLDRLKSSHPATPERIQASLAATGRPPKSVPDSDTTGRAQFMEAIEGLAFGPNVKEGLARRGELILPGPRLVIPLPDAIATAHAPSGKQDEAGTWLVAHPQSGADMKIMTLTLTEGRSAAALVKNLLPTLHGEVQQVRLGTPTNPVYGQTATYRYLNSSKRFRLLAVPAAPGEDKMVIVVMGYPNEATFNKEDGNLMTILKGIHHISEDRAKRYQPLVLHSFRAAAGDTVANRASKLPVGALQEDLFRALNNLPGRTEMTPGQLYKTIVDPNA